MASKAHASSWSILPAEIRLKIYALLFNFGYEETLHKRSQIFVTEGWRPNQDVAWFKYSSPACPVPLLCTSKSISAEASFILYSENHFRSRSLQTCLSFANIIGPTNASFIRNLTLDILVLVTGDEFSRSSTEFVDIALKFPSLRRLDYSRLVTGEFFYRDTYRRKNMIAILRAALALLRAHPTLCLTASECFVNRLLPEQDWTAMRFGDIQITFLAREDDGVSTDGPIFDIHKVIEGLERLTSSSTL